MGDQLGTILTSLAALIVAAGGFYTQKGRKDHTDRKADARKLDKYRRRDQIALEHMLRLELMLQAQTSVRAPDRPPELAPDFLFDDDDAKQVKS